MFHWFVLSKKSLEKYICINFIISIYLLFYNKSILSRIKFERYKKGSLHELKSRGTTLKL